MLPLQEADPSQFRDVRFVLTDMDETLTYRGRLGARTYHALERLQAAGIVVIPVTAAPAGWCDQMARMWPVDGAIGENGGLFYRRRQDELDRLYWESDTVLRKCTLEKLRAAARAIVGNVPTAELAEDQPFRLTSVAFRRSEMPSVNAAIRAALIETGADVTANNLWILGWFGSYDKLAMTRRVMNDVYRVDIETARDCVLYVGDSVNDAPMFGHFRHTVGVSTVTEHLADIPVPPAWIARGPGGDGFVEAADAVIAACNNR